MLQPFLLVARLSCCLLIDYFIELVEQANNRDIEREQQQRAEKGDDHLGPEGGGGGEWRNEMDRDFVVLLVPEVEAGEPAGELQAPVGKLCSGGAEAEAEEAEGDVDEGCAVGEVAAKGAENGDEGAGDVLAPTKRDGGDGVGVIEAEDEKQDTGNAKKNGEWN